MSGDDKEKRVVFTPNSDGLNERWERDLKSLRTKYTKADEKKHDPREHGDKSRLIITQLFLRCYFILIAAAFGFCYVYNSWAAKANIELIAKLSVDITGKSQQLHDLIPYLDVSNTVSIITTTLSSGVGFVIGYYFKNKGE